MQEAPCHHGTGTSSENCRHREAQGSGQSAGLQHLPFSRNVTYFHISPGDAGKQRELFSFFSSLPRPHLAKVKRGCGWDQAILPENCVTLSAVCREGSALRPGQGPCLHLQPLQVTDPHTGHSPTPHLLKHRPRLLAKEHIVAGIFCKEMGAGRTTPTCFRARTAQSPDLRRAQPSQGEEADIYMLPLP